MVSSERLRTRENDAVKRPLTALAWWGLPLALGWSADILKVPRPAEPLVWSMALTWMGAGCALNARRCHRLHCYISAPVLFAGAAAVALIGLGLAPVAPQASGYVVDAALAAALLSFGAEAVFGKHFTR